MNERPLYISATDHAKLRLLLEAFAGSSRSETLQKLRGELDRAVVLDAPAVPPDVVTMNAGFEIEDLATGEVEGYTLTYPDQADVERGRLSILAPIGTAVIGYAVGDVVDWRTPGGVRRLKIKRVTPPAPAATTVDGGLPLPEGARES